MQGNSNRKKDIIGKISAVLAVVILYVFLSLTGVGCPIKFITGISCAGCGMTRAWIHVLKLDFKGAFYYHPLFFLPPVAVILFSLKNHIKYKIYINSMLTLGITFVTIFIVRIIWFQNEIIVFNPSDNIIFKIIRWVQLNY